MNTLSTLLRSNWAQHLRIRRGLLAATLAILTVGSAITSAFGATDKYRLSLRQDPSTSMVIGWNQVSGSSPAVHYDTVDHGTSWSSYANSRTPDRTVSSFGMNNNFVRLTGLTPDTKYYFVIHDSNSTSSRMYFKTAPANPAQMSFVAGGDSRNNRTPRQNANRIVSKVKPTAVLFGGDFTDNNSSSQWINWMNDWQYTKSSDGRMYPVVAARGNHDSNSACINLFDVPSSNVYFALTFANLVRTYTLNSEISAGGSQRSWLISDLEANSSITWKFAQYHKPMRPHTSGKSEGSDEYNNWAQPFYDHKVNLVVECDSHTVKRTYPVRPATGSGSDEGFIRDDATGTVYIGEGCWGAPLRSSNDSKNWTRAAGQFNQVNWIQVHTNKVDIITIKVDNATSVGEVSESNPFNWPSNLDVWTPSSGHTVTLLPIGGGGGPTPPPNEGTIDVAISASSDDAEQLSNGTVYLDSSDLELVNDAANGGDQTVGLVFKDIQIPQGAYIQNAYVQFTVDENNDAAGTKTIKGLDVDSASTFASATNNISSRATTTASASWDPAAWSTVGASGADQRTSDIKEVIQEIVDRSGWTHGNNIGIVITGTGRRTAEAFDGTAAPRLVVTYGGSPPPPPPPTSGTISVRVNSGMDDVEEGTNGSVYTNSSDLELVYDSYNSQGNQKVGLMFRGINIPQGANIVNAYVQFTVDENANDAGVKTITGNDVNNAADFATNNGNVSSRQRTTASVNWDPPSWTSVGAAGVDQRTPDLKSIIQEIVDRGGWVHGNNIALIIEGSGRRTAESYDGSSGSAPLLFVEYDDGGTTPPPPPPDADLAVEHGVVSNVGSGSWSTVSLTNGFLNPVVVVTPQYPAGALPAVARVRNAGASSFQVKVENPSGTALSGFDVHYVVAEAGVYTQADDGIKMDVLTFNSTVTDRKGSWVSEGLTVTNSYSNPIVIGQVMTSGSAWSNFWANGGAQGTPPSASTIKVGKHVAEDTNTTRGNETLGVIVLEAGSGTMGGLTYAAGITSDTVRGVDNDGGLDVAISGLSSIDAAILTSAAMDGGDGGWPVHRAAPNGTTIKISVDEDQIQNSERSHTTEQLAYLVFEGAGAPPPPPPSTQQFEKRVNSTNDDAEEREDNGSMYRTSSDLELVRDGSKGNQTIGMRFTGVTIPSGAVIEKAYVQFHVDETDYSAGTLTIWGQDTGDASTFSSTAYNISTRTRTSASVNWSPPQWNTVSAEGADQRTPELKTIVQEITDRGDWSSGNDMVIIIRGTGEVVAESYDGESGAAPKLYVEYHIP